MTRTSLPLFVAFSALVFACGGAVEPSPSSSSSSAAPAWTVQSGGPATSATGTTAPHPTTGPGAPATSWSAQASGCANVFVFDRDATGARFLVVSGDKTTMGLGGLGDSYTGDLSAAGAVHLSADTFDAPPIHPPYCTDIAPATPLRRTTARGVRGSVTITMTSVGRDTEGYAVDVTLKGVVVQAADGTTERVPDVTWKSVFVGWLPG